MTPESQEEMVNEMGKEFNLSDKITFVKKDEDWILLPSDVKEFIKRLKDEYMKYKDSFKTLEDYYRIFDDMEKLAGDKLT